MWASKTLPELEQLGGFMSIQKQYIIGTLQ